MRVRVHAPTIWPPESTAYPGSRSAFEGTRAELDRGEGVLLSIDLEPCSVGELPERFRRCAEALELYAPAAAVAWRKAAEMTSAAIAQPAAETLSIARAAEEYGWSYEGLRRKVARDPDLNAGTRGNPAVRRSTMDQLGRRGARKPRAGAGQGKVRAAAPSTAARRQFEKIRTQALGTRRSHG